MTTRALAEKRKWNRRKRCTKRRCAACKTFRVIFTTLTRLRAGMSYWQMNYFWKAFHARPASFFK